MGSARALPPRYPFDWVPHLPLHLVTTSSAASFHRRHGHLCLQFFLHSSFKKFFRLCHVPRLNDFDWFSGAFHFKGIEFPQLANDALPSSFSSCLSFFNGREIRSNRGKEGKPSMAAARRNLFNGRQWTNILLAVNVLMYIAQNATQGKLLFWGAKINSLIGKGQFWRLVTSSFLHVNVAHLMVNCYSLNSIGPTMEKLSGPRRFLAVYFTSAIASSAMSYWFCKGPAVGASGAIFGLVGSYTVFVMRHRGIIGGGREELQQVALTICLNMVFGILSKGIDNWGHLGGLLGGVAVSWLVGPAWKFESITKDGRIFSDKAPIFNLIGRNQKPRRLT